MGALLIRRYAGIAPGGGLVDDTLSHDGELGVLPTADRAQPGQRVVRGTAGTAADQADGLLDHRPRGQRRLQLPGQRERFGTDLRVVHGDGGTPSKQFAQFRRVVIEDILVVGVAVDGADQLTGQQQGQ